MLERGRAIRWVGRRGPVRWDQGEGGRVIRQVWEKGSGWLGRWGEGGNVRRVRERERGGEGGGGAEVC